VEEALALGPHPNEAIAEPSGIEPTMSVSAVPSAAADASMTIVVGPFRTTGRSATVDALPGTPIDEIAGLMQRGSGELGRAHASGIVHGAISPANIRLTTPQDARLTGWMLGPASGADASADMTGLAATLYVMVTGRAPPEEQEAQPRHACALIGAGGLRAPLLRAIDPEIGRASCRQRV